MCRDRSKIAETSNPRSPGAEFAEFAEMCLEKEQPLSRQPLLSTLSPVLTIEEVARLLRISRGVSSNTASHMELPRGE